MATVPNNTVPVTSNPPAGVPWEQTPEYIALTNWVIPLGGRSTYLVPHPVGASPTDVTSFLFGQANITLNSWPEFMYMLHPTPEWKAARKNAKPAQKLDQNGQPMFERYPEVGTAARAILDYRGLPDTISTAEHWWFFDIWRRLHPQMNWEDIFMRMEVPNRDEDRDRLFQNSVQTGIGRKWHKRYHMVAASWFGTGRGAEQATKRVHEALQAANIPTNLNTTRGVTPGPVDPRQPNGRHVAHPDLRERRYNPRGRKQRRARARSSNDVSEDEDISELRGASEDNATTGEQPGEGSLAARTNATPSLSPAPEDAIASRLRSGSRRISPPATSFTPVNVPEPSRRRSTPKSSAPKSKPSENRIVKQQTTKKLRPITFPPCPTANLQARMLESGMSGHEFDSLVARTLAPIEGEYGPSRPVSTPRRQHRTNMDATDSPMYDSQAENRPARRTNPAPIEPATRPMGPPVTPSRRVPGYPRGGNSYGPPLPDYTEAVVQRHPSLQDNLPAFPIPPVAPMYTPAAFRFGTAYATAQQFDFRIQYPLPEAHTDAPMPAPRQPPDYQGEAYASSPQVHDVNEVRGSSLSDRSVDNTCRQDSTGYEPRDSHFESDGIFHEYEGW